jgi:HEAT repeat protein
MQTLDLIGLVALIMIGLNALSLVCTATLRVWNARRTRWLEGKVEIFEPALYDFLNTGKVSPELKDARGRECEVLSTLVSKLISVLPDEQDHRKLANLAEDLGLIRRDLNQLRSKKIRERARAAENLGFYGGPDVVGDLSRLLSEDHETPRVLAARALSRIATPEAARALVDRLDSTSELTRLRMISNLERMGPVATEPLMELLDDENKPSQARVLAVKALGNLQATEARGSLRRIARREDIDLSAQAVLALGKLGDLEDLDVVLEAAEKDQWPLRVQAANALGMMGKETTIPDLKRLMTDSEWWVRTNAGSALSKMGAAGERTLVEMLDSPDTYARERAAASLENGGAVRRAVNELTESGERAAWARTLIRRITRTEVSKHLRYLEETLSNDEKRDALQDAMSGGHDS